MFNKEIKELNPRIVCNDGFSISVQAREGAYCEPRNDEGPYIRVECGFPSKIPGPELFKYAEDPTNPTETVYSYVPTYIVELEIRAHGGIKTGKFPDGCILYGSNENETDNEL